MKTLEELLTFKEGDPHVESVRANLKEALKNKRWELVAKKADLDAISTPTDPDADNHEVLEAQRVASMEARTYELGNILAAFNSLEGQLAALPPDRAEAAKSRRARAGV